MQPTGCDAHAHLTFFGCTCRLGCLTGHHSNACLSLVSAVVVAQSDMHDWLLSLSLSLSLSPLAGSQFQRRLNSHFGVTLSEEEQRRVLRKYDKRGTGMVNYREFLCCMLYVCVVCVCTCCMLYILTIPYHPSSLQP